MKNNKGPKTDRTGVGTISEFAKHIEWDLSNGFPLLYSKFTAFKTMYTELQFFFKGLTNNNWLTERNCNIWTNWAREDGELGPIYGAQLRNFNNSGFDQLNYVIDLLKKNPSSRRIMFSYYNPLVLPVEGQDHSVNIDNGKAVLPPCHVLYMFNVEERDGEKYLNGSLTQRSADFLLGSPFNISQLALIVHILAHHTGMKPGKIFYYMNDCHIYLNQIEDMNKWLDFIYEEHLMDKFTYPKLVINESPDTHPEDYGPDSLHIEGYNHLGKFRFAIAV